MSYGKFTSSVNRYFVDNGATEWWLTGLKTTLLVTVLALCIGVVLGLLIALIRSTHEQTGKLKLLNIVARVYLTIIRGTPSMIQILFFYSVIFATVNLNNIVIGGIAFGINSGAYVAEIFRSGIMSVDKGQTEAGRSLGLNSAQTMRLIIIPQAFKNVLPALINEMIVLLKETASSAISEPLILQRQRPWYRAVRTMRWFRFFPQRSFI